MQADLSDAKGLDGESLDAWVEAHGSERVFAWVVEAFCDKVDAEEIGRPFEVAFVAFTVDDVLERTIRLAPTDVPVVTEGRGSAPDVVLEWQRMSDTIRVENCDLHLGSVVGAGRCRVRGAEDDVRLLSSAYCHGPTERAAESSPVRLGGRLRGASDRELKAAARRVDMGALLEETLRMFVGTLELRGNMSYDDGISMCWVIDTSPPNQRWAVVDGGRIVVSPEGPGRPDLTLRWDTPVSFLKLVAKGPDRTEQAVEVVDALVNGRLRVDGRRELLAGLAGMRPYNE